MYKTLLQKEILAKKSFCNVFLRFKMLHFPPPSGDCCSRTKGHVTGPRDIRSCVAILLLQRRWLKERRKPCLWKVFAEAGIDETETSCMNGFLNTGHIVSYFPQKSCHQTEMAEIVQKRCVDFKALTACATLCFDILFIICSPIFVWTVNLMVTICK